MMKLFLHFRKGSPVLCTPHQLVPRDISEVAGKILVSVISQDRFNVSHSGKAGI